MDQQRRWTSSGGRRATWQGKTRQDSQQAAQPGVDEPTTKKKSKGSEAYRQFCRRESGGLKFTKASLCDLGMRFKALPPLELERLQQIGARAAAARRLMTNAAAKTSRPCRSKVLQAHLKRRKREVLKTKGAWHFAQELAAAEQHQEKTRASPSLSALQKATAKAKASKIDAKARAVDQEARLIAFSEAQAAVASISLLGERVVPEPSFSSGGHAAAWMPDLFAEAARALRLCVVFKQNRALVA